MADLRIYVACLAAYNNGILHGEWIDVDGKDADDIQAEVAAMLASSPIPNAEEWAIHDHEGFPFGTVGEYTSLTEIVEIAEAIEEHGEVFIAALKYWGDKEDARKAAAEGYQGEYKSEEDWAESFLEDTGSLADVPENLRNYIDFEAYARDARLSGDVVFVEGDNGVHVFNTNW